MPRKPRPDIAGGWHHVMNRGGRHQMIFHDNHDRSEFIELAIEATDRYKLECHAYCLMSNHFHFVVHCPDGGLSAAFRFLQSQYVKKFNSRYSFDGALFKGRFVSVNIRSDSQLLWTTRYVHRNPLAIPNNDPLAAYLWSSYGSYLGEPPEFKHADGNYILKANNLSSSNYRDLVEINCDSDKLKSRLLPSQHTVTSIEAVRAKLENAAHTYDLSTKIVLDSLSQAALEVANKLHATPTGLANPDPRVLARKYFVHIAKNELKLSVRLIANYLEFPNPRSVYSIIAAAKDFETDSLHAEPLKHLREQTK